MTSTEASRVSPSGLAVRSETLPTLSKARVSMIFVPSVDGLSHNIAEYTTPDDIAAGANVLLHALMDLAAR